MAEMQRVHTFGGKNFLWDGRRYESEEEAAATEKQYRDQGFEVQRLSSEGKLLLYTRRSASST